MCLYLGNILPLENELKQMRDRENDTVLVYCGFELAIAVSLRETNQVKLLASLDEQMLPTVIRLCSTKYKKELYAKYLLWRIKKYSKDFTVKFSKDDMEILSKVPDERPAHPGKIGNE